MTSRILVVRRDNIGDLVCATPLLAALRRQFPGAHIAALVNSYNAAVLAGNPDVDAVHVYTKLKHRGPAESWIATVLASWRLLSALRTPPFDHVILAKSGFDRHGLAMARRLRSRNIVGFAPEEPIDQELHEVEVVMKLAARLGVAGPPGPVRVFAVPERIARWRSRLPNGPRRWIALHISARKPEKTWPAGHFLDLAKRLGRDPGIGFVLLWAPGPAGDPRHPGDDARAAEVTRAADAGVPLFAARTETLEDLIAALALCRAFIGSDGGAMHLAAGLGLPIVALFENIASKQRHWHPWQVPYEIVAPETGDFSAIPVDRVEQAWVRLCARLP
ncbi:MAG TPA: glycosyltransferase family 9 protein [Burkholderiales bacterium]|nr:glycosyltransferase family 9 protein [Burkholderiales bacterium]